MSATQSNLLSTKTNITIFRDALLHIRHTWLSQGYSKKWSGHGVTADIVYGGKTILSRAKSKSGTYCVAATFQAFCTAYMKASHRSGKENWLANKSIEDFRRFRWIWFIRKDRFKDDPKVSKQIRSGCAYALVDAGIGAKIKVKDLRPGDFIQFWWTTSKKKEGGHSAIVHRIERHNGKTTIVYWSSQETNRTAHGKKAKPGYGFYSRELGKRGEVGKIFEIHAARVRSIK